MRNRIGRNRSRHPYCLSGPPALLHFFISTAESALAGIAALVPVGSAPELSHKRTEPQLSPRPRWTWSMSEGRLQIRKTTDRRRRAG
jgi:hypothetical protein